MAEREAASSAPSPGRKVNPELLWLGAVFLLAVVMRTIAALTRDMIQADEASYLRMAENLLLGKAPLEITGTSATQFSILYPFVIASLTVVFKNYVFTGYLVSVLFGSLLVLPVYMLGKNMWNQRVATAAAALTAVLPVLVDAGSSIDAANIYAFWLLCAVFFGYRMQFTKRCMCGMLAGTCLGLAFLSGPGALYYLVVLAVMLVVIGLRQEVANYANKAVAHFLLMFLLFAVPGVIFTSYMNGGFSLSGKPATPVYAAVNGFREGTLDWEREAYGLDADGQLNLERIQQGDGYLASLWHRPGDTLAATARSAWHEYFRGIQSLVPVWLLPLVGLGMFAVVWTRREALKYGYLAVVAAPMLVLPVTSSNVYFFLPYAGMVMLPAARGWLKLEEWLLGTADEIAGYGGISARWKGVLKVGLALLMLLPLAGFAFWTVTRVQYHPEYRRAGERLADSGGDGARVMSAETATAYYAGSELVPAPYAEPDRVLDYARDKDVDFLVVSRRMVSEKRPLLAPLLGDGEDYGLEVAYEDGEQGLVVYRLVGSR